MTNQEIFDTVARHLLTQKEKCGEGALCNYRRGGLKCAVGVLIPDELYSSAIEGIPVDHFFLEEDALLPSPEVAAVSAWFKRTFPDGQNRLIDELQVVHDSWKVEEWKDELAHVAYTFYLNKAVLEEDYP